MEHNCHDYLVQGEACVTRGWWEYTLTVRPWVGGGRGPRRKPEPPRKLVIVARSAFDATYAYKSKHPKMLVLSCVWGKRAKSPAEDGR